MKTRNDTASGKAAQLTLEHAQLIIKEETPKKLILETNPSRPNTAYRRESSMVLIGLVALITAFFLVSSLTSLLKINILWGTILGIISSLIIFVALMFISQKNLDRLQKSRDYHLVTTITIESDHNRVSHAKTFEGNMSDQKELSLDQVDKITLFSVDYSPMPPEKWPSVVAFNLTDNSSFTINSGHREEMIFTANKIASLIEKSVEEKYVSSPKELPR